MISIVPVLDEKKIPKGCNIITGKVRNSVYMGDRLDLFFLCGKKNEYTFRASVARDYNIKEGSVISFAVPYDKTRIVQD